MTISIDGTRCQGHGRCLLIDSEVFDLDEDGLGTVLDAEPGPDHRTMIDQAIATCPEQAIIRS